LRFLKAILNNDKRRATRRACDTDACIRQQGSFKTHECRVIDISECGVRLTANDANAIPDRFLFFLKKGDVGREALVRWRRGTQIGAELEMTTAASRVDGTTNKLPVPVLAGVAVSVILLISMYELAGSGGAGIVLGMVLLFLGLRTPAGA
jgi:hypothetical protein